MRLAYVRVSPTHPYDMQRKALEAVGFTDWADGAPVYVDLRPRRGEASWYWRGKLLSAIRSGEADEVWVAEASVWGSSASDAVEALRALTAKGGALCIANTSERFQWHPDTEGALALVARIAKENARRNTDAAREKRRSNTRERKARDARKLKRAQDLWADRSLTGQEAADKAGLSRATMIRLFGPRGTPRFASPRKESR